ncbi:MAG TPA: diguanylate cyclase [Solirubrobacterales bacterium]|nr:diguanylate cyclase [Solirubrobacterales bacterium]
MMVSSAALIFVGAAALNLIEVAVPGGPPLSLLPGVASLGLAAVLYFCGRRFPVAAMALLGPIGAALIAYALATTPGVSDGAVLYLWPVLWEAYFFGRRGAIGIVVWVALVHGVALATMVNGGNFDRWLDVVVVAAVVAAVVELLSARNRQLLEELAAEAQVDNLTGLLNRRGFAERGRVELARAKREVDWLGVASFDLDHFKAVNDEFGHDVGDQVLVRAAELFQGQMRDTDVLARVGGEEFVALLPGDGIAAAEALAERVRTALAESEHPSLPRVTVSIGVASAVAPDRLEEILKGADRALYEAKAGGRNRTVAQVGSTAVLGG